ncbi:MAG: riboflavin biosynthesis protein RibF [Deltaproteobacteria bacterium]|nr:riboflavin biosynthesis protein RibF [Deltaproteobacteria bacterium]
MRVVLGSHLVEPQTGGHVVTIGNFDGVHLGHRALISAARARAHARGLPLVVYTFDPAPRDVLRPGNDIPRIQCLEDRLTLLAEQGVDLAVVEPFSAELAARGAQRFAEEVLRDRLQAAELVLGWDFRFGAGRTGDAAALQGWLAVPVTTFGPWRDGDELASSSRIRQATRAGDLELTNRLLGRPHVLVGEVIPGDQRGRTMGWRTANVRPRTALLPPDGVYAVLGELEDGARHQGIANLGLRPTFGEGARVLEVHLFGYQGDIYGRTLRTHLVSRLRDERRFASRDALIHQIGLDIEEAHLALDANQARSEGDAQDKSR